MKRIPKLPSKYSVNSWKNCINLIFCIFAAGLLMWQISYRGGWLVLMLLTIAAVLSTWINIESYSKTGFDISLSTAVALKGDGFEAVVTVNKGSILPTSFMDITLFVTPNIGAAPSDLTFKTVAIGRRSNVIKIPLSAELCGEGEVGIKSVLFSGYLGIIQYDRADCGNACKIKIIPRIPDTGAQAELLKLTAENTDFDDDNDETDETTTGRTGMPGYEYRQYVNGDPLKLINWKISSKRESLMVRLDEKATASCVEFLLDYPEKENADRAYYENADLMVESVLAMLAILTRSGFESRLTFWLDGWQTVDISDERSLHKLQNRLAGIKPCPPRYRAAAQGTFENVICFTTCTADMTMQISSLLENKGLAPVVGENSGIGRISDNMWSVNRDFEFKRIK